MKNLSISAIFGLGLIAILLFLIFSIIYKEDIKPLLAKTGQVWVHQHEQNPFEPIKRDSTFILEIRDKYCKYRRVFYEDSVKTGEIIATDKIKYVIRFSKKVKINHHE